MNKHKQLQACIAAANAHLEEARMLADELGFPFEFLGRQYLPKKTVTTGGHWDHEHSPSQVGEWKSSDDGWNSSGIGC